MGQVCEKHQTYYWDECRWCESAKAAIAAPLRCTLWVGPGNTRCGAPAMWRWTPVSPLAIKFAAGSDVHAYCEQHHAPGIEYYPDEDWKKERLP